MTTATDTFTGLLDAYNRHDIDALREFYTEDCVEISPNEKLDGRDAITADAANLWAAFPDTRLEVLNVVHGDDHRAIEYIWHGTSTSAYNMADGSTIEPTGKAVHLRGCSISKLRDGKICSVHQYFDRAEMMEQLGGTTS